MCEIRAKDKDGKVVYGWYFEDDVDGNGLKPFLMPHLPEFKLWADMIPIDISTAAVKTGKKDKNGDDIYGSKDDMEGGDMVKRSSMTKAPVWWSGNGWYVGTTYMGDITAELEIIKEQD